MADIDIAEVKNMKVPDLRKHLQDRELSTKGNKAELVERLENALLEQFNPAIEDAAPSTSAEPSSNPVSTETAPSSSPASTTPVETPSPAPASTGVELNSMEKRAQRASRFGIELQKTDEEKLAERSKRFGIVSEETKRQQRKERFGIETEADKLAKRKQRFGGDDQQTTAKRAAPTVDSRLDSPLGLKKNNNTKKRFRNK